MVTLTLIQGVVNTFVIFLARVVGYFVDQMLRKNDDAHSGPGIGYMVTVVICDILFGILASIIVMYFSRRPGRYANPRHIAADDRSTAPFGRPGARRIAEEHGGLRDFRRRWSDGAVFQSSADRRPHRRHASPCSIVCRLSGLTHAVFVGRLGA
jgi:hypothetical protein